MAKVKDLKGRRFGKLVVLSEAGRTPRGGAIWRCRCDCGNDKTVVSHHLQEGTTTSCGCFMRESKRSHGMYGTKTYIAWANMVARCTRPGRPDFKNYGGRGITVCKRWRTFKNFYADMGDCPDGFSLDRIDNSKGYSPSNCRWAARETQDNNKRRNRLITHDGKSMTVTQWAKAHGIRPTLLRQRLFRDGWPIDRALLSSTRTAPGASR